MQVHMIFHTERLDLWKLSSNLKGHPFASHQVIKTKLLFSSGFQPPPSGRYDRINFHHCILPAKGPPCGHSASRLLLENLSRSTGTQWCDASPRWSRFSTADSPTKKKKYGGHPKIDGKLQKWNQLVLWNSFSQWKKSKLCVCLVSSYERIAQSKSRLLIKNHKADMLRHSHLNLNPIKFPGFHG